MLVGGVTIAPGLVAAPPVDASKERLPGWSEQFSREVDHRLDVPQAEQQRYILLLQHTLTEAGKTEIRAQAIVLVDRSAQVQAAMVIVRTPDGGWHWLGATAVSTGKTGRSEERRVGKEC